MKADELVALAGAHRVDISHSVAAATNTQGIAAARRRAPEEIVQGLEVIRTAYGRDSRVLRAAEWTLAETGIGAGGVKRMPWLAACYSWLGDRASYAELHRGLTREAIHLAEERGWPWKIPFADGTHGYYIERLGELVLDEDGCKRAFVAAPGLYSIYLGVSEHVWGRRMFRYFLQLQDRYLRWLDVARGTIAARLREDAG